MAEEVNELERRQKVAALLDENPDVADSLQDSVELTAASLAGNMTVSQLREQAEALGVDLTGARLKDEIAAVIAKAISPGAQEPNGQPEGAGTPPSGPSLPVEGVEPPDHPYPEPKPALSTPNLLSETGDLPGDSEYSNVHHMVRLITAAQSDGRGVLTGAEANALLAQYFQQGYDLLGIDHVGIESGGFAAGHNFLWLLGLRRDRKSKFQDIKHVVRVIGNSEGGITAQNADALIAYDIADGWGVFAMKTLGFSPSGINVLWVLVR